MLELLGDSKAVADATAKLEKIETLKAIEAQVEQQQAIQTAEKTEQTPLLNEKYDQDVNSRGKSPVGTVVTFI